MTNERKAFIDKYIKEMISTPSNGCNLYDLLGNSCDSCKLSVGYSCINPWYIGIFNLLNKEDSKDEIYNSNMNEILTYISNTYPEAFV